MGERKHKHDFQRKLTALQHLCEDHDTIIKELSEIATLLRQLNSRIFYLLLILILAVCALAGVRLVLPPAPA